MHKNDGLYDAPPSHRQGDGRKPLPHIVTAILSILITLGLSHYGHVGATGPSGPPGSTVVQETRVGVCEYFGPDSTGRTRLQLFAPTSSGACMKGNYVRL